MNWKTRLRIRKYSLSAVAVLGIAMLIPFSSTLAAPDCEDPKHQNNPKCSPQPLDPGGSAVAKGHNVEQLKRAGFICFEWGLYDWVHCLKEKMWGKRSVPVKVFDTDGTTFLGTELLLHKDVYAGQPCPQNDLDIWDYEDPYFACHHFLTSP